MNRPHISEVIQGIVISLQNLNRGENKTWQHIIRFWL